MHVTEKVSLNTDTSSNNDELFGEYANQFFYEKDAATAPATSIGTPLKNYFYTHYIVD